MKTLNIKQVSNSKELQDFLYLPWKLYKDDPNWVPPLKMALNDLFKSTHPFYETSEQVNFLAIRNEEIVGRISAIWPSSYNKKNNEMVGFFGFFEGLEDQDIAHALIAKAEEWLKDKGAQKVQGPCNPTTNYECGLLIKGFDDPPQIMMPYNPEFYVKLIEQEGYAKTKDLLAYKTSPFVDLPPALLRVSERLEKKSRITYRNLDKSKFDSEVETMLEIYNDAWEDNWGFIQMTEKEFRHTAKDLKSIVDERLVTFAEIDGNAVGFVLALPDLNQVFKKIPSGRIFPFGFLKLLNYRKHVNRARIITLGVKREYKKSGLGSLLFKKIQDGMFEASIYKMIEASWILEDNYDMNRPMTRINADPYKTYRIYEKSLSS